jgi:BlaI family penicillinase repressor
MAPGRRKKSRSSLNLTPLELDLMQIIWTCGNATASEISSALKNSRPLADTTIHTMLANMRKKGYIEPVPTVERALRFAPLISRDEIAGKTLKSLILDFFGGSPKRLMAHLLKQEKVDERELAEIRKMIRNSKLKGGEKS